MTAASGSIAIYDSDERVPPFVAVVRNLWRYRGLLRLLVVRDLTVRYKRSLLGVWWTLLNPMLTAGVMYIVFSNVFRFEIPGGLPFVVYLLSGILLVTFFAQGVNAVGVSLVSSASVISKIYVPPEVFALSAACAAAVNFSVSLLPLAAALLLTGVGISSGALLLFVPVLAMLCLVTGVGLLVATAAIRFPDTLDLAAVGVLLLSYLTPTFYPISIVPDKFLLFVLSNPLYSYLAVFRELSYGANAPWWCYIVMLTTAIGTLLLGAWTFTRRWPSLAALL